MQAGRSNEFEAKSNLMDNKMTTFGQSEAIVISS